MLLIVLLVVGVLIVGVLALAATRPDTFRVERKATIEAPPEKVFALLSDFHRWEAWSPWEKRDPAMKRTHSGAASGKGAAYAWEGNREVGKGRMEITAASPPSHLTIQLDFLAPFECHNFAEFTLTPRGGATEVTWAMHGPSSFLFKLMGLFMNMDKMVGRDFEVGLANLAAVAPK